MYGYLVPEVLSNFTAHIQNPYAVLPTYKGCCFIYHVLQTSIVPRACACFIPAGAGRRPVTHATYNIQCQEFVTVKIQYCHQLCNSNNSESLYV